MILVKIHEYRESIVVSLCDENLIGKKFSEGDLELNITERFYKGENLPEDKILELIKNANNLNVVGEESIKFAIKNKLINKQDIIKIKNIPHAIIL
ncbi:DUF424 family protein [archaeon]|nr:DUF424 family protein [archaeon]